MNKATRYICAFLAFGFLVSALVVVMQQLTGTRESEYFLPCVLLGGGFVAGWFAWHFDSVVAAPDACSSDDTSSESHADEEQSAGGGNAI